MHKRVICVSIAVLISGLLIALIVFVLCAEPAHTHSYGEWTVINYPTCDMEGLWSRSCSCGESVTIDVPKLGHELKLISSTSSSCDEAGKKIYKCSRCDETETISYPALGHDFVLVSTTPSTCIDAGTEEWKCNRCDETSIKSLPLSEHQFEVETEILPTCTQGRFVESYCKFCRQKSIDESLPLGHIVPSDYSFSEINHYKKCERCGDRIMSEMHDFKEIKQEPTCIRDGYLFRACLECGYIEADEVLTSGGHSLGEWAIILDPTCAKEGIRVKQCEHCEEIIEFETIPTIGHVTDEQIIKPTCTEAGYTLISCTKCDFERVENLLPALGHTGGEWKTITTPTCTEEGLKQKSCIICSAILETERSLSLGHSFTADKCDKCGIYRYNISITYLYSENYQRAADPVMLTVLEGESYYIPSPQINGYIPDILAVEGKGEGNVNKIVYYSKIQIPATDLIVDPTELKLTVGEAFKIEATVKPNSANQSVFWTTENNLIASVKDGVVTAIALGTVTITASTADGSLKRDILVEVYEERVLDIWDGEVARGFESGFGTKSDPYLISTSSQLAYLASQVNSGTRYSGTYFKLMSDLDLNNFEWTPIGNCDSDDFDFSQKWTNVFSGNFDGNGHIIFNLNLSSSCVRIGLFGVVAGDSISHLTIKNANVRSTGFMTAILCAQAFDAKIERCAVYGNVSVNYYGDESSFAGTIAAIMGMTTIENCFSCATVKAVYSGASNTFAGGLVGGLQSNSSGNVILNCYFDGSVEVSALTGYAAGILGTSGRNTVGSILNCFAVGIFTASKNGYVDAIYNFWISPTISTDNCYYNAEVSSKYGTVAEISDFKSKAFLKDTLRWDFDNVWKFAADNSYPELR